MGKTYKVQVLKVVDGDTIHIRHNHQREIVRLVYIDTPELFSINMLEQTIAYKAKQFVKELIEKAKEISIQIAPSSRDKGGRLLAMVFINGQALQELLVRKGLAWVRYYWKQPNIHTVRRQVETLKRLENEAKRKQLGLWQYEQENFRLKYRAISL
ncbi:thermonuclease family protein [Thermoflavimicrobium daqui]|uniref:TNase-like domain-containing protein n=1 Tax=Thermoflavimicrobium daqui TaxID=2137476 RepID=A0A364K4H3_9BACL|nr:thermonuclease family protein [Thermoflavimicrobium daqui]RAL24263.1 hypothetical protein DL897_11330 [Thermoflavimicrobium daqui]